MLETPIELLKCFSVHLVECVSKISSVLSIIFHAFYGAISIQQNDLSYNDCDNTFTLSYHHHQIRILTHLSLFWVRSWNNGMSCVFFYILIGWILEQQGHWWIQLRPFYQHLEATLRARSMGPTWDPPVADRTQVIPMLAPWTLLSEWAIGCLVDWPLDKLCEMG